MGRGRSGAKKRAAAAEAAAEEKAYEAQKAAEQAQIDAFMQTKGDYNSLEVNGSIFEKLSYKELRKWMKDIFFAYEDGTVDNDDQWAFEYNDGTVAIYGGGDAVEGARKTGIKNAIYSNANTTAFYGPDIEIYDFDEENSRKWHDTDWRADWRTR